MSPVSLPQIQSSASNDSGAECGKCITCGFLAQMTTHVAVPVIYSEVPAERRTDAMLFRLNVPSAHLANSEPCCIKGKANFGAEVDIARWASRHVTGGDWQALNAETLEVLKRDRKCEAWARYHVGVSPTRLLELEQLERLELRLEADRRAWQKAIADTQDEGNRRFNRLTTVLTVLGLALAVVQITQDCLVVRLFPWLGRQVWGQAAPDPVQPSP